MIRILLLLFAFILAVPVVLPALPHADRAAFFPGGLSYPKVNDPNPPQRLTGPKIAARPGWARVEWLNRPRRPLRFPWDEYDLPGIPSPRNLTLDFG